MKLGEGVLLTSQVMRVLSKAQLSIALTLAPQSWGFFPNALKIAGQRLQMSEWQHSDKGSSIKNLKTCFLGVCWWNGKHGNVSNLGHTGKAPQSPVPAVHWDSSHTGVSSHRHLESHVSVYFASIFFRKKSHPSFNLFTPETVKLSPKVLENVCLESLPEYVLFQEGIQQQRSAWTDVVL